MQGRQEGGRALEPVLLQGVRPQLLTVVLLKPWHPSKNLCGIHRMAYIKKKKKGLFTKLGGILNLHSFCQCDRFGKPQKLAHRQLHLESTQV